MYSGEKTCNQAPLEAGPSGGIQQPTIVEGYLENIVVDNPSNVLHASTLSSRILKPRPSNLADKYEIVGGVPAFVWRSPQNHNPYYQTYAISYDNSRIAIKVDKSRICVYDMLDNFSLVAKWEDENYQDIHGLTFHNNKNNELVVVFQDSTVALMHIAIKSKDAMERSKSGQQESMRIEINSEFRILDNYEDINALAYDVANESCETWVVAWDSNVRNTTIVVSIIQNKFQRLQIKSEDSIIPTFPYCLISQKALLLVSIMANTYKPLRTRFVHDIDFTKKVIDYSPRTIENGQSFGFSDCGQQYFLIWRYIQGGEDTLELYKIQSLKQSLDLIARKSLGLGMVTIRAKFIKNTSEAIEVFNLDVQDSPIVAFTVARANQVKLTIWAPITNATLKEIDLTMREMTSSNPIHVEFCISPNLKWVAIGCLSNGIFGLFSILSGMQIWNIKLDTSITLLNTIVPLKFDNSSTRLIINACNTLYVVCPPCLVEDYCLEFQSATYDIVKDFEEQTSPLKLGHYLLIPKHMLMQMFFLKHELESHNIKEVLDIARSTIAPSMALLVCKDDVLTVLLGSYEVFFESSFQKYIESKWSQDELPSSISKLKVENLPVKQSIFSSEHQIVWIFLYLNEERNRDLVVVFLSQDSLQGVFIDLYNMQCQERVSFSAQGCFAIKQNKDGSKVSSLYASGVMVIDLNQRVILKDIRYQVNLSQLLCPHTTNRIKDCIDVTSDGRTILIGWDSKKMKLLTLTPQMVEEECKAMFVGKSNMVPTCMFGEDLNKAIFLKSLNDDQKVPSICIYSTKGCSLKSITDKEWNPQTKRVIYIIIQENFLNYALCCDASNGQLWIIVLQKTNAFSQLIFLPINPWSEEGCIPFLYMRDYPTREINELDELISRFGLSFFNMTFGGKTNFRIAFENKDKALMNKLLSYSNQVDLSLNDVLVGSFEEDFSHNFLKLAIENKNEAGVTFFFDLLEKRSLPFEQGASMLSDEFSNLWMHYRSMLELKITSNCLERQICDIEVPIEVVSGSNEARLGTINSIDCWEYAANRGTMNAYYRSLHREALKKIEKKGNNTTTTAMVIVFTIGNMCKIGLHGIIRPLLMHEAPSHVFGTSLLKGVVNFKWEKVWKKRSQKSLLFYLVYILLYSIYSIWIALRRGGLDQGMMPRVCLTILLFLLMIFASIILYQKYVELKTYIRDRKRLFPHDMMWGLKKYWSSTWNTIEVISYLVVILVIPIFHFLNLLDIDVLSIFLACIAVESILIWMKVWYFGQVFLRTERFVSMFENIVKDCVGFSSLVLAILVSFSFAFFILFQEALHSKKSIDAQDDNNETRDIIEQSFGDPWKAIVTMFYATIGTFEPKIYQASGSLSILITIMFVFYIATQMIAMFNMLIAIMGDTFDRVKSTEEEQLLMRRARFIDVCEAQLSITDIDAIESSIGKYLYFLCPKDEYVTDDIRLWQGRVKTIEDRVGKMIRESEHKVLQKIDENNKVMKDDITKLKEMKDDMSGIEQVKDSVEKVKGDINKLKEIKEDISELKEMKDNLEKLKDDISELKEMKEDNERMQGDINEIKQMLRSMTTWDGQRRLR